MIQRKERPRQAGDADLRAQPVGIFVACGTTVVPRTAALGMTRRRFAASPDRGLELGEATEGRIRRVES
jgi:hypothetical protein